MALATWLVLAAAGANADACLTTFDEVVAATEVEYAGYVTKLPDDAAKQAYRRFRALMRARARDATDHASCFEVLDGYVGFFADHHLFVASRDQAGPGLPVPARRWNERRIRHYLQDSPALDPVEGLWFDSEGRIAVVHDPALAPGHYLALRLAEEGPAKPLASIERRHDGYRIRHRHAQWDWQTTGAGLVRGGQLFAFGVSAWGRADAPGLDPEDPQAPRFETLAPGQHYLSLPSFMPRYREPLQKIIAEHGGDMAAADSLIVDVRGNAGGDAIYFPLAPYFLANGIQISDDSSVRASPWTISYFEGFRSRLGEQGAWLDAPLAAMRAAPGQVVPYQSASHDGMPSYPEKPAQVLVLQDRGVGSAAEAFIYHARQSAKVVTMGEPTRGNIDYMQVSMHPLGKGEYAVWFGYPLYFKRGLPAHSVDDEGYAPDVHLAGDDWLGFAREWASVRTTAE